MEGLREIIQDRKWILGGDFNIILSLVEKKGGIQRLDNDSEGLKNLIETFLLVDLESTNGDFTWTNRRSDTQQITCQLDRFLVFENLMLEVHALESSILTVPGSDHWPIQLWMDITCTPRCKPFRFKKIWLSHLDFQPNIQKRWTEAIIPHDTSMYKFQQKLKNLKIRLKEWNKILSTISSKPSVIGSKE